MRFAADLHLHSRHSEGVSPAMTIESIAFWAQRKGVDLLGTGDCLQAQWLDEIEETTVAAESGFRALKPEMEQAVWAKLPPHLRTRLRFVLSTEVSCVPADTPEIEGIHHLIYFPSCEVARHFAARMARYGDLSQGRPALALSSRQLLQCVLKHDPRCHLVPAHVMNPWFSALGVVGGETSMETLFGDLTPQVWAVETGLTSNPEMCRRVLSLDRFALFSNSDAHSLGNLGRECTLLEIEPSYDALFEALRTGQKDRVLGTLKFPLNRTRYFLNWCSRCREPFPEPSLCPRCGKSLTMGSRDRLNEFLAGSDRPTRRHRENDPPFETLAPLAYAIATAQERKPESAVVKRAADALVDAVGSERFVLTEASEEALSAASSSPAIAHTIVAQRTGTVPRWGRAVLPVPKIPLGQSELLFDRS